MGRQFMGGDFRAISKAEPVVAEVEPDPRLALVDLFKDTQVAQTSGTIDLAAPLPDGVIDLSGDAPDFSAFFVEDEQKPQYVDEALKEHWLETAGVGDAQEPVVEPEPVTGDAGPDEAATPEDEAPADAEPDEKVEPSQEKQDEQDYDPIAAVLG